jgi:hypothetical protein
MMQFWYSAKQEEQNNKTNYVNVNGEMKEYTEIKHNTESVYNDAILVCEREEGDYSGIELDIENQIDSMMYDDMIDDESFYQEDMY